LNLRRAREQLAGIKERIATGTFSFADEFPNFRDLKSVPDSGSRRTCSHVFDAFLAHCESRVAQNDMAPITVSSYRRVLNTFWRPKIGEMPFLAVRYSMLVRIADEAPWSKKTYNNAISVLRRAFKFGYHDHPDRHDPTLALKSARIRKKDRATIDPFTIQDAETIIAVIREDWGEAQGNYDEFRLFSGLRPSEQVAVLVSDFDPTHGTLTISKARVGGIDKNTTKTGEDRRIELCPRALQVLNRQLALRQRLVEAHKIDHEHLFFKETGEPIRNLQYAHSRWRRTLERLPRIRYRKPYCARHSSVSWSLMIGRSALWVAKQHGHSIATMLRVYAGWTEGAIQTDLDAIKRAMTTTPPRIMRPPAEPTPAPVNATNQSNTARRVARPKRDRLPYSDMALDLSLARGRRHVSVRAERNYLAEREGFEPSKGF
jgi:integrase